MKRLFFTTVIILIACSASKTNNKVVADNLSSKPDSLPFIPPCLQKKIDQYKAEEKQNPPRQVYSYVYKGQTVYYVTPPCCDFFSDLYDSSCALIGHPDGGFTGRGDGKITDFKDAKSNEKLIWKDGRK